MKRDKPRGAEMRGRLRRLWDWGKNLLIVLLVCSAVYLFLRTQNDMLSINWFPGGLSAILPGSDPTASDGGGASLPDGPVRPVRIVVKDAGQAARYGMQYSAETDVVFETAGRLLAEAIGSADSPRRVAEPAFRAALGHASIYFDFLGHIPLPSLCLWLAHTENDALPDAPVRRMAVAQPASGGTGLYYINESDGLYYVCNLDEGLAARLSDLTAAQTPNRAQFAYEAGDAFTTLAPYTLLLSEPPEPAVYAVRSPLGTVSADALSPPLQQLLTALRFSPQPGGIYQSSDGIGVREGAESLRVSGSGVVSYRAPEGGSDRYPAADPLSAARAIVESAVSPLCGAARLALTDFKVDGTRTVMTFSYLLDGAQVVLSGGVPAAEVTAEGGFLLEFSLHLRLYEGTDARHPILPELQAVAALDALRVPGGELLLRYEDTGLGLCLPTWGV